VAAPVPEVPKNPRKSSRQAVDVALRVAAV
jgi:hypothetical protein